jgi:hypothetical protein
VGFKDKMQEAAAQAAAQARKAAEQAKDLAADVKGQASEKWAEDQQKRAAQDAPAPPSGTGSANSAPETGAPIAGRLNAGRPRSRRVLPSRRHHHRRRLQCRDSGRR